MTSPVSNDPRVQCPVDQSEEQYNLREAFPDYPQVSEQWKAASAALRQAVLPQVDLAYGDKPLQKLDYFSANKPNAPLLIFVHGGYWQGGDKADVSFVGAPYIQAGINVASINYSLAPAARIEDMVVEVRQAIVWLAEQAQTLGFDINRISLMGHSAGGHLVASMVAQGMVEAGLPAIENVFAISGVFDLPPLLPSSINNALSLDATRAEALSPITHKGPEHTRVYTIIGGDETQQFHEQSEALARVWKVAEHFNVPGTHHFTVMNVLGDPQSQYSKAIVQAILNPVQS